ncbi:hypothetical protein LTR56_005408 [Elasticomyces elasticus]|nr:hypothetical protein LTR22_020639 [Elasticomyces elasticus]KAK3651899.1 hypothetical protein LTR56_005408 [Elasticomyces elasticus]KAK4927794.1 hypothetical protein LTR49_005420 [Elasticomyces elasticus]KAK5761465.1 hypothetical protein LTS12_008428 [Elasticomyces elasticus]
MTLQDVLDVPELFESILLELEPKQLFLSQRVCKQFRATIEGTPSIQRRLCLSLHEGDASLPVELSHVLTTMRSKKYNVKDRQTAYINTGRNYWRVTQCIFTQGGDYGMASVPKLLNLGVESVEKRWPGRRQFKAGQTLPEPCSAMAAYLTSKPVKVLVKISFVDRWGEEAMTSLDTKEEVILRVGELLGQVDDTVDEYNEAHAHGDDAVCDYCDGVHRIGYCEFAPVESGPPLRNQFVTLGNVDAVIDHESWLQQCDLESWLATAGMGPEEVGVADTHLSSDSDSETDRESIDETEVSASEFDPDVNSDVSADYMSVDEDDITSAGNSVLEPEPSGSADLSDSEDDSSSLFDHPGAEFKPEDPRPAVRSASRSTGRHQHNVSGVTSTGTAPRPFIIATIAKKGTFKVTFSAFRERLSLEKRLRLVAECGPRFEPLVAPEERLALEFEALRAVLRPLGNKAKTSQSE